MRYYQMKLSRALATTAAAFAAFYALPSAAYEIVLNFGK